MGFAGCGKRGWSSEVRHCSRLALTLGWTRWGGDPSPGTANVSFLFSDLSGWLGTYSPLDWECGEEFL